MKYWYVKIQVDTFELSIVINLVASMCAYCIIGTMYVYVYL